MRSILPHFTAALLIALPTLPAHAKDQMIVCQMGKPTQGLNWVTSTYSFLFRESGEIQVVDAMVLQAYGEARKTRARVRGNGKIRMKWDVNGLKTDTSIPFPTMALTADMSADRDNVRVFASLPEYAITVEAKGVCKPHKQ